MDNKKPKGAKRGPKPNPEKRQSGFLPKVRIHPKRREAFEAQLEQDGRDPSQTIKNLVEMYTQGIIKQEHFERIQHGL